MYLMLKERLQTEHRTTQNTFAMLYFLYKLVKLLLASDKLGDDCCDVSKEEQNDQNVE